MIICYLIRTEMKDECNLMNLSTKYLIKTFSKPLIGSNVLSLQEDLNFVSLLFMRINCINSFKLLYRGSEHNFSASKFHELCDDHAKTCCIIQSDWGNIFGGYTSCPWSKSYNHKSDPTAFIFLIRSLDKEQEEICPIIYECLDETKAVYHHPENGPSFGAYGLDITIMDNCADSNKNINFTSNIFKYPLNNRIKPICGGIPKKTYFNICNYFTVIEYEIFQIK